MLNDAKGYDRFVAVIRSSEERNNSKFLAHIKKKKYNKDEEFPLKERDDEDVKDEGNPMIHTMGKQRGQTLSIHFLFFFLSLVYSIRRSLCFY